MMKKLWEKNYQQDKLAQSFCFGDSAVLDNKLVIDDVLGSMAHGQMLAKIGILTGKEYKKLKKYLLKVIKLVQTGKFKVEIEDEDVHTKVENYLTEKLGSLGKKIHTGRSRNDQVLVDLRLYTKDNLFLISKSCLELAKEFIKLATKYEFIPMPGYTHMQKAMPSSVGLWSASFTESLIDDLILVKSAFIVNDQSPLGSGAAYGVSLPINRELTSQLLGFSKVQNNSLYCQASRCKSHLAVMHSLVQIMLTLSRFAQDLLLFTTSEFNFFTVGQEFCTGSSIMPQKKNLDVMEFIRAKTQMVISYEQMVASIAAGLPSGYNADFGETKLPFIKSIETVLESLKVCLFVAKSIHPNIDILTKACTSEIFATHWAYQLVKKGMSFRDAYLKVGLSLAKIPNFDPVEVLKISNHSGGPGNLGLAKLSANAKTIKVWWQKKHDYYQKSIKNLKGGEKNAG
jgi:argininosuccinate lyase